MLCNKSLETPSKRKCTVDLTDCSQRSEAKSDNPKKCRAAYMRQYRADKASVERRAKLNEYKRNFTATNRSDTKEKHCQCMRENIEKMKHLHKKAKYIMNT